MDKQEVNELLSTPIKDAIGRPVQLGGKPLLVMDFLSEIITTVMPEKERYRCSEIILQVLTDTGSINYLDSVIFLNETVRECLSSPNVNPLLSAYYLVTYRNFMSNSKNDAVRESFKNIYIGLPDIG